MSGSPSSFSQTPRERDRQRLFDAPKDPHVLDFLTLWARHRVLGITLIVLGGVVAFVLGSLMPKTFESTATVLPPDRSSSADLLNRFQATGALKLLKESENPSVDLLQNIIESRRTADAIGRDPEVRSYYTNRIAPSGDFSSVIDWVHSTLLVVPGPTQLKVTATVETSWRATGSEEDTAKALAARIANLAYQSMYAFFQSQLQTSAHIARVAAESDLHSKEAELDSLEQARQVFEEQHKAIALPKQIQALISLDAELRGRVAVLRQQQIAADRYLKPSADSAQYLASLVGAATQAVSEFEDNGELGPALSELPALTRSYAELDRGVKALEPVVIFLRQEVEQERINETRERDVVQLLDAAIPPKKKSAPKRSIMLLLGLTIGLGASFLYVSSRAFISDLRSRAILLRSNSLLEAEGV